MCTSVSARGAIAGDSPTQSPSRFSQVRGASAGGLALALLLHSTRNRDTIWTWTRIAAVGTSLAQSPAVQLPDFRTRHMRTSSHSTSNFELSVDQDTSNTASWSS